MVGSALLVPPARLARRPPPRRVRRLRLTASARARLTRGRALARRVAHALGWRRFAWTVIASVLAYALATPAGLRPLGNTEAAHPSAGMPVVAAADSAAATPAFTRMEALPEVAPSAVSRTPPDAVTVRRGDTLWEIAARVAGPREDVRAVIERLRRLNGLSGVALAEGQVLRLSR